MSEDRGQRSEVGHLRDQILEDRGQRGGVRPSVFCFLFSVLCLLSPVLRAEESTSSVHKIGVVNVEKLFQEYERTKAANAQMEQLSNTKQGERERVVSEIKNLREELALLNEQARGVRQGQMEEKLKGLANFDQQAKESLKKQWDESMKRILDEIETAVTSYAKAHGFELILSEKAVLYYEKETTDVTDEVLETLNASYKKQRGP